jgi:DNA invertase Pin-like site-specific DNA recombinase
VGRPIAASEAQQLEVRKLRKAGKSLRAIADELTLSLHTVVTITSKEAGTDRTTIKHLARIDRTMVRSSIPEVATMPRECMCFAPVPCPPP